MEGDGAVVADADGDAGTVYDFADVVGVSAGDGEGEDADTDQTLIVILSVSEGSLSVRRLGQRFFTPFRMTVGGADDCYAEVG